MKVNLHTHSTFSDGLLTPKDLVITLKEVGVELIALTDHDSISGLIDAKKEADKLGIRFINGIEMSSKVSDLKIDFLDPNEHTLHLLGLGFEYDKIVTLLNEKKELKNKRLIELNNLLIKEGYQISIIQDLEKRTQIANELIRKNYANNLDKAFEIINIYYERWQDEFTIKEAIRFIHQSGGYIIWAHPFEILEGRTKFVLVENQIEQILKQLVSLGLDGIEVYYEKYNQKQVEYLKKLMNKYNLITSAGTDYHAKPNQPVKFIDVEAKSIKEFL